MIWKVEEGGFCCSVGEVLEEVGGEGVKVLSVGDCGG